MTPITAHSDIKSYLMTILGSDLGTWKDGTIAVWIGEPPSHLAPSTGPQLIINPVGNGPTTSSGDLKFIDQSFEIRIVNAAVNALPNSLSEIARILQRSRHCRNVIWIAQSQNTAEQVTAKFYAPGFVAMV